MQYDPNELTLLEQRLTAAGFGIADVCRRAEMAPTTVSRWKKSPTKPRGVSWRRFVRAAESLLKAKRAA
jgi:hypothetical protein